MDWLKNSIGVTKTIGSLDFFSPILSDTLFRYTSRYRTRSHGHKLFLNQYEEETIIYAWILDIPSQNLPIPRVKISDKVGLLEKIDEKSPKFRR